MLRYILRTKWHWILVLLLIPLTAAWAEMYVEGYLGGAQALNSSMETSTPQVGFLGCTSKALKHEIPGRFEPAVMGGLKAGYWFTPQGFLGYNYPKVMKHFGVYLDFNYHRLNFRRQVGQTLDKSDTLIYEPLISNQPNEFFSNGSHFIACMIKARTAAIRQPIIKIMAKANNSLAPRTVGKFPMLSPPLYPNT